MFGVSCVFAPPSSTFPLGASMIDSVRGVERCPLQTHVEGQRRFASVPRPVPAGPRARTPEAAAGAALSGRRLRDSGLVAGMGNDQRRAPRIGTRTIGWIVAIVSLLGCRHKPKTYTFEPSVTPRNASGVYEVSVRLPDWADVNAPWLSSFVPLSCAVKSGHLVADLAPDLKHWPYEWPETVECSQGSRAVQFRIQPVQPTASTWMAEDGTVVIPTRSGHVAIMQRVVIPNVVSAVALVPGAGYGCGVRESNLKSSLLEFRAEDVLSAGQYICRLTQTDGTVVDQLFAVVHYKVEE